MEIGRRIPRNWFKRGFQKMGDIITMQEQTWYLITSSINLTKKRANQSNTGLIFITETDKEPEDINYQIEWLHLTIKGTPDQEADEYKDMLKFYEPLGKVFEKNPFKNSNNTDFTSMFKSKIVNAAKIEKMYKEGINESGANTIQNKLLELGILSHIEWIKDEKKPASLEETK
jgi:hypothetical protein